MQTIIDHMTRTFNNILLTLEYPKAWAITTAFFFFINQYIFSQWNFAFGFFIIFLLDTIGGSYIAYRRKVFCFKTFKEKLMDKSLAYFSIICSYSVGTKIVLEGADDNLIKLLDIPFYSIFITAEIFSILRNWYRYKRWPALRMLMKHFKGFDDETGKIKKPSDKDSTPKEPSDEEKI